MASKAASKAGPQSQGDGGKSSRLWEAPAAPATRWYPAATEDLDEHIDKPHVPRAEHAVDREHPRGSLNHATHGLSVLQQHVAFFDRNQDGIIYPWETYQGFRAIGFNFLLSLGAAFLINGAFSWFSLDGWFPSPLFPIYIKNIHKTKHGSDSEVYDTQGRFVPQKFEEIFAKFDRGNKGGLYLLELWEMTEVNRNVLDWFGWLAAKLEWGMTYLLCRDDRGIVSKDAMRGVFDGSFFEYMESNLSPHPHTH